MCHVPWIEAEAEVTIGIVTVRADPREVSLYEYVTVAKSLVMLKPDTRMGWMSLPYIRKTTIDCFLMCTVRDFS